MEYNIVGAANSEVDAAIQKRWGSEPDKVGYAQQIAVIAGDYSRNLPKGLSKEEKVSKREFRRNAKRKITEQARAQIKPVGMIPAFIFMAIISAIIQFFVTRLMHHYFDETPKGMFYEVENENEEIEDQDDN